MERQDERWIKLCDLAAVEQDPIKLGELVKEINDLLEAKHKQDGRKPAPAGDGKA